MRHMGVACGSMYTHYKPHTPGLMVAELMKEWRVHRSRVAALEDPGVGHFSRSCPTIGFVLCNHRPSVRSASDCRWCTETAGGRARSKSVFEKLFALKNA